MTTRPLIALGILTTVSVAGCGVRQDHRPPHPPPSQNPPPPPPPTPPRSEIPPPTAPLTARDNSTGIVFRVADNGRTLTATNPTGRVVWTVDVIDNAGPPAVGAPVIRPLSLVNGQLAVVYGKHSFANFDPKTGKLLSSGSD